jgi:GT2 family glycosyltransferase
MSEQPQPDVSIIIPSVNGWQDLDPCLDALHAQSDGIALEIIVADRVGDPLRKPLRAKYPGVRLLEALPLTTIPALRARAMRAARAEVVGVIEDHVIVPPDWSRRMLAAHGTGAEVVGGRVENAACERVVDWAAFLCEYSHCLVPPVGSAPWLTGNNVTYRRRVLEQFRVVVDEERWENHLHEAIRQAGVTLFSCPEISVGHKKHYTVGEYLHQRYLYARSYAGLRVSEVGGFQRLGYGLAAFALPPLLFLRITYRVWRTGRHRKHLLQSLPLLGIFVIAWAGGEVVGYWFGSGDSLGKVC